MKQKPTKTVVVVVPGDAAWELWQWSPNPIRIREAETPGALNPPRDAIVCLPSSELSAAALWLSTKDEARIPQMADLQAEAVFHGGQEHARNWRTVRQDEQRTLVLVVQSPADPRSLADISMAAQCVPLTSAFRFEQDSITLYRELGKWIAVATAGPSVVAFTRLGETELDAGTAAELRALRLRLSAEQVAFIAGVVVWDEPQTEEFARTLQRQGLACRYVERPLPNVPSGEMNLLPLRFTAAKNRHDAITRLYSGALIFGGILALLLLAFLGRYGWMEWEYHHFTSGNAAIRAEADSLRDAASSWDSLQPAINPNAFALEWLHQFAIGLPDKGVRLTRFHMDAKGNLTLTGEADGAGLIVEYQNTLAATPKFAVLHLNMPPPQIQANNLARFEITAGRKGAASREIP